ncbi:WXG100 family type VII secretion target [Saccharopolyspora soli]|uniref:WXG100 family type VII secretion target n=1 Tax=Saccharopolyspora soli TaxID=2926618 RepID=UPI001F57F822|nr:WXG100 family type VII secretion target [Saccharopolyspora soli]
MNDADPPRPPVDNPLVSKPQDSSEWYTGVGLLEAVADVVAAIETGDWTDVGFAVVGAGLETLSTITDPLGSMFSAALSFLIEHFQPLTDALNWLGGDADAVRAHAQTWRNIADSLRTTADTLEADVQRGTAGWTGAAADAYRARLATTAQLIRAQSEAASGLSSAAETAGTVVAMVRATIRDFIAECAGRLAAWAIEALASRGSALPLIIEQASLRIARWGVRVAEMIVKLIRALTKLLPLLDKLGELVGRIGKILNEITHGNPLPQPPNKPRNPNNPNTPRNPNDPPNDPPDTPGTGHPDPDDPFDNLPPHEQEDLIRKVIEDSRGGMTREAAIASLRDGPPGTKPFVDEKNAPGPDIRFQDNNGNDVLNRENKALNGTENSFNTNTKKACKQLGEDGGEIFYQVPEGTSTAELNSWVDRWRGRRDTTDYQGVNLIFCDSSGRIIGKGNLASGRIE